MIELYRASVLLLTLLTLVTGVVCPIVVSCVAQIANVRIKYDCGRAIGPALNGQTFSKPEYFWGRLPATGPGDSTLGPHNPTLRDVANARLDALLKYHKNQKPPADLRTASSRGVDPHISPAAAEFQVLRVAEARKLSVETVRELVAENIELLQWGVLSESRVNVLKLNLDLDKHK